MEEYIKFAKIKFISNFENKLNNITQTSHINFIYAP